MDGDALMATLEPEQIVAPFAEMVGWGLTTTLSVVGKAQLPVKGVKV